MYHSQSTRFNYTKHSLVFDLKKQKSFNYGQLYVALFRANSLLGLTIVGNLKKEFVKVHPNVIKEYERLHSYSNALLDSSQRLITILNIRSVCKHVADVLQMKD